MADTTAWFEVAINCGPVLEVIEEAIALTKKLIGTDIPCTLEVPDAPYILGDDLVARPSPELIEVVEELRRLAADV
jgi:hypothetical protein